MRPTARALVLALALVVLLTGCHPPTLTKVRGWPGSTPVFASEDEALAAAEEAYGEYVRVADQIFIEGGANPERLAEVATGDFLKASIEGFQTVQREGLRSTGGTTFRDMIVQNYSPRSDASIISVYVCEDVSNVDVVDATGNSVVALDRPPTALLQVTFDLEARRRLLLASREAWSDESC
jgi:hypothetical protein